MSRAPAWLALARRLPPELAHAAALRLARFYPAPPVAAPSALRTRLGPLELAHPVGLAAGFDKNGVAVGPLARLGFSHLEIGTVTPCSQPGNPRPRLFRLPADEALINRLGFPSEGVEVVARRLQHWRARGVRVVLGANIGPNRDSADPRGDYVRLYRRLAPLVDYVSVNVSSPNTPGLRDLQNVARLGPILEALAEEAARGPARPLLVKLAPDLAAPDIEALVELAVAHGVAGLVLTNTTVARPRGLRGAAAREAGGLSGRPLAPLARRALEVAARAARGRLTLVAAGGILDAEEAWRRIRLGASVLQVYTALVYRGPAVVRELVEGLAARLAREGVPSLAGVVGADLATGAQPSSTSS